MAAIKRKQETAVESNVLKKPKKSDVGLKKRQVGGPGVRIPFLEDPESNLSSEEVDDLEHLSEDGEAELEETDPLPKTKKPATTSAKADTNGADADAVVNGNSSRESHVKQKALAQERKAAKPNADSIARSKKLWERLRRKSHVPKEERETLVKELFEIITGKVKDFVFKHDSVRVIQCAIKYGTPEQKRQIARELKGNFRELAESRYAKFLIAKLIVGDNEIRDIIVPEFYGHVKRLIRQPEASWIVDDIYRTLATPEQKTKLLREWYGPEFVIFRSGSSKTKESAELSKILAESPEKKGPIMQHLKEMTNQLVQKKTTGYTMLHDALLQYFLNCRPGSPEATEFLEMLKDDEGGDCFKNLAFTKSGARLVCLALAYGNSKDRRTILKFFKTHIKLLAGDVNGHLVLLACYEVIDDTVMSSKAIFPELFGKDLESGQRNQELLDQSVHLVSRIPLLYPFGPEPPKWLLPEGDKEIIHEIREIRTATSKKEPETRRAELMKAMSQPLLDLVADNAEILAQSSFGCQFVTEVLLGGIGEKEAASNAIAQLTQSTGEKSVFETAYASRMLKSLVQGGRYDPATKSIKQLEPPLGFHNVLYGIIEKDLEGKIMGWALGNNSFVVLALLEAPNFDRRAEVAKILMNHRKQLKDGDSKGAKMILENLGKPK